MALPLFHTDKALSEPGIRIELPETSSRHIVQVLRMKAGDRMLLTDGNGFLAEAEIFADNRKRCGVELIEVRSVPPCSPEITLAVSLLKNTARFEWLLEKAAELGIQQIIPLQCARSEKAAFKPDRCNSILVSAMLQSRQSHQTRLAAPMPLRQLLAAPDFTEKFLAHCLNERKRTNLASLIWPEPSAKRHLLMLIGPEGDFTPEEIALAAEHKCVEVSLGENRLRTETAAITAAVLLRQLSA
jgi:16S rRNA (uracil1498-N3)-methyltransferase